MFNKGSKSRLKIIKQDNGAIVFDKNQGVKDFIQSLKKGGI